MYKKELSQKPRLIVQKEKTYNYYEFPVGRRACASHSNTEAAPQATLIFPVNPPRRNGMDSPHTQRADPSTAHAMDRSPANPR
jgi:hypothetical protein